MSTVVRLVQSVSEFAVRQINVLEERIVKAEDSADALLWQQALKVVEQVEAGLSQRELARQWINARTGKPYHRRHVAFVMEAYLQAGELTRRPRFRDVYNEVANATPAATGTSKLAVHHSSETPEHYTPPEFLQSVYAVFTGVPDLDPCAESHRNPNVSAKKHYTRADDGLAKPWRGRVFVNPPYGDELPAWVDKLRAEWDRGQVRELLALLPARTDTAWFQTLTRDTDDALVCFLYRAAHVCRQRGRRTVSVHGGVLRSSSRRVRVGVRPGWQSRQRPARPLEWFVSRG